MNIEYDCGRLPVSLAQLVDASFYITLECVLVPVVQPTAEMQEPAVEEPAVEEDTPAEEAQPTVGTTVINDHLPASMAYWIQSTDPRFHRPPQMFVGPTCVERCLDVLQRDVDYILWILRCDLYY